MAENISLTTPNLIELELYTDMAMNECQRWMELITREKFMNPDDFLLSLRKGYQFRRLLNIVMPGAISISNDKIRQEDWSSDSNNEIPPVKSHRCHIDKRTWITKFLYICRSSLRLRENQLFRVSDLDFVEARFDEWPVNFEFLSKIRRVVVTIAELASLVENSSRCFYPKIDRTALDPLVKIHQAMKDQDQIFCPSSNEKDHNEKFCSSNGLTNEFSYESLVKQGANLDCVSEPEIYGLEWMLKKSVDSTDQIANSDKQEIFCEKLDSASGEESETEMEKSTNFRQSKFLQKFSDATKLPISAYKNGINADENDVISEKASNEKVLGKMKNEEISLKSDFDPHELAERQFDQTTLSPTTVSSQLFEEEDFELFCSRNGEKLDPSQIPTRLPTKNTNSDFSTKTALKYVQAKSALDETAKQQIIMVEEQKKIIGLKPTKVDKDEEWKRDLDSWTKKRKLMRKKSNEYSEIFNQKKKGAENYINILDKTECGKKLENFFKEMAEKGTGTNELGENLAAVIVRNSGVSKPPDILSGQLSHGLNVEMTGIECSSKFTSSLSSNGNSMSSSLSPYGSSTSQSDDLNAAVRQKMKTFEMLSREKIHTYKNCHKKLVDSTNKSSDYDELMFNIQQKPNVAQGFGFVLIHAPGAVLLVGSLTKGSSADKSRVLLGDEVLEIDRRPVVQAPMEIVERLVREAVRCGHIEMKIRRCTKKKTIQENGNIGPTKIGQEIEGNFEQCPATIKAPMQSLNGDYVEKWQEKMEKIKTTCGYTKPSHDFGVELTSNSTKSSYKDSTKGEQIDMTFNKLFSEISTPFGQSPMNTNGSVNFINSPVINSHRSQKDTDLQGNGLKFSQNLNADDLNELNYLKLASMDQRDATQMGFHSKVTDLADHWLIKETENLRLTDQLKVERLQKMNDDQNSLKKYANSVLKKNFDSSKDANLSFRNGPIFDQCMLARTQENGGRFETARDPFDGNDSSQSESLDGCHVMNDEQVCSHCAGSLGQGAAMAIEPLQLFFHLECFKCYACCCPLGDGSKGADVRVKNKKLHCHTCYNSNLQGADESSLL